MTHSMLIVDALEHSIPVEDMLVGRFYRVITSINPNYRGGLICRINKTDVGIWAFTEDGLALFTNQLVNGCESVRGVRADRFAMMNF